MDTETVNKRVEQIAELSKEIRTLNDELKPLFKTIESEKWQTLPRELRRAQSIFLLIIEKLEVVMVLSSESEKESILEIRMGRAIRKSRKGLAIVSGYIKVKELYET